MRHDYVPRPPSSGNSLKPLLYVLGGVYLLQMIIATWFPNPNSPYSFIEAIFALSMPNISRGFLQTLVTYGFLHSTSSLFPTHLIFNGLLIYFAGQPVHARLGPTRFLELFLGSLVFGGIIWIGVQAILPFASHPQSILIGASSGAYGILSLFCFAHWNQTIRFFFWFIPVSLEGKKIFYILLGLQGFLFLFGELSPRAQTTTAHSAHLGGIGFAYLYHQFFAHRNTLWSYLSKFIPSKTSRANKQAATGKYTVNIRKQPTKEVRREVDRILDKINNQGFGALTPSEKETLDQAKDILR